MLVTQEVQNSTDQQSLQNYLNQLQQVSTPLPSSFPTSISSLVGSSNSSTLQQLTTSATQPNKSGGIDIGYLIFSIILTIIPFAAMIIKAKYKASR